MPELNDRVEVMEGLPWVDPDLAGRMSTDKDKAGVAPTSGPPHRLTIYVPWAAELWTMANFGQEHATKDFANGLFFRTREHIHWQTHESFVCLGGPSSHIQWSRDTVPGSSEGYSAVTQRDAYHHADLQHLLRATEGDIIGRAMSSKTAVLQSDGGTTAVNSGAQVRINAVDKLWLTAHLGYEPATNTYSLDNGTPWPTQGHSKGVSHYANMAAKIGSIGQTTGILIGQLWSPLKMALDRKKGVKTAAAVALAKAALTAGKVAAAAGGFFSRGQSIKGSADIGVGVWGNRNGTIYAEIASVIGSLGVSLLGAATADVKGYATAGVWAGSKACLASRSRSSSVVAHFGKVAIDAEQTASFVSDDSVMVTSKLWDATLRAGSRAAVYGGSRAYVGANAKYGLVVNGNSIELGPVESGDDFASAKVKKRHGVYINNQRVLFQWQKSKVAVAKDYAMIRYKKKGIKLHSGGLTAKAKGINVDA